MIVLLTKSSSFQNYFANSLFKSGCIDSIFIEEGISVSNSNNNIENIKRALTTIPLSNPRKAFHRIKYLLKKSKYYGHQNEYDRQILEKDFLSIYPDLQVHKVRSLNDEESILKISSLKPDLILVFGTGLLRENFLKTFNCSILNLHWGLSPTYRGEGIVTALALGGVSDLGYTVHHIDGGIDSGKILFQKDIEVDSGDNFYSIGLKITKDATTNFESLIKDFQNNGGLLPEGSIQDLNLGKNYTSKFMVRNPELFQLAWKQLKRKKK